MTAAKRQRTTEREIEALREKLFCELDESKRLDATVKRLQKKLDVATQAQQEAESFVAQLVETIKILPKQSRLAAEYRTLRQPLDQGADRFSRSSTEEVRRLKTEIAALKQAPAKLPDPSIREMKLEDDVKRLSERFTESQHRESKLSCALEVVRAQSRADQSTLMHLYAELRRHNIWETIGTTLVGIAAASSGAKQSAADKPAETKDPVAPSSAPPEPDWGAKVRFARRRGWLPMLDALVQRKMEELQAEDALAQYQQRRGHPVTARALPTDIKLDDLAAREALRARWHYHANPPPDRQGRVSWARSPHKLDRQSEQDLLQRTKQRIDELRRPLAP